ncbi:hypothetical protein [Alsobacter sp. SYSU BS001988]
MAIDWSAIKSKAIREAFRRALSDDKHLSHAEVVEVMRSVMADGDLDEEEIADLKKIAETSETIPERSKQMIENLAYDAYLTWGYGTINVSTSRQRYAAELIFSFMKRMGAPVFPRLDRDRVGIDLLLRVSNPNIINQRQATLCGPVSFLYSLALDSPAMYAKYAIDLYEKGKATIGRMEIKPSYDCRHYFPPAPISPGDWLTAGSLRDSENILFDYESVDDSGSATNADLARWFSTAGYTDIHADDNITFSRDASDIALVNGYYNAGYRVALRINSKLLYPSKRNDSSHRGNHFVVLRSPIAVSGDAVTLTVYTWGMGQTRVPEPDAQLTKSGFLEHWYGYVAGKPF